MNGYPYKTLAQMGVQSEAEAFIATKQAIYLFLNNFDINDYSGTSSAAGQRTINALRNIVSAAQSSADTKVSSNLTITQNSNLWDTDSINKKYISKTFTVTAKAAIQKYTIQLSRRIPGRNTYY